MRKGTATLAIGLNLISVTASATVVRQADASRSFAGSNLYFLHGLPEADQVSYIETLAHWGVKVMRLWVAQVDAVCTKGSTDLRSIPALENTVGIYDTTVLDALDDTLKILSDNGMKAIISPHNANSLTGSARCDAYCNKYGDASTFYSAPEAKSDYDARLNAILTYESPNFGINMLEKALQCDAIDIMSVHGYMGKAEDWAYFITGDDTVLPAAKAAGRHVMMKEWGVSVDFQDEFEAQVAVFNDAGVPWLYWQVVPDLDGSQDGDPADCGYDSFEIGIDSPKGDVAAAVATANQMTANQSWVGYVY